MKKELQGLYRAGLKAVGLSLVLVTPALAQLTSPQTSLPSIAIPKIERPSVSTRSSTAIVESPIEPQEYHVGPGDEFDVHYWTMNTTEQAYVSPAMTLTVPRVGTFDVRGKTLQEVQDTVAKVVAEVFHYGLSRSKSEQFPVTLSLSAPRQIYVTVAGDVLHPQTYTTSAGVRADHAVAMANVKTDDGSSRQLTIGDDVAVRKDELAASTLPYFGQRKAGEASERYIRVAHSDGTVSRVDIVRYRATHDPAASPLLREGDVVYVPYRDRHVGSIGVYGAVLAPGDFEYVAGDSLSSMIRYAFGFAPNADSLHVELTHAEPDGTLQTKVYDLPKIYAHEAPDVALRPADRIVVPGTEVWTKAAIVNVRGEVAQPGMIPIVDGKTKLSDVIRAVGGFRSDADLRASVITRRGYDQSSGVGTAADEDGIVRLSNFPVTDTANFARQIKLRTPNVVADMYGLFVNGDSAKDVVLRDGDQITVPMKTNTVYVYGFVNTPGFVSVIPNGSIDDYIRAAGGYAGGAVPSEARVIKAYSKAWVAPSTTTIESGDEIYIPKESDYSENYSLTVAQTVVAISGALIGIITFMISVLKP